ncbi:EAL and GGDEF domain-containing protein [Legionella israelensis]|uniref:Sensory box (GGDEF/EAL domain) regulatory protein n=1 Tax=Legionella israelensis TaxID=454 RepID=A0A0W0WE37_9GAMM|nr:EAL domain-containing protein [Legionella israelensis]KTD30599.1 sensory box (GGDEF/EAL domain) regulatory protein [Legionella israelensis]QBS10763.1 EAL domain-containing protein [Legionella israelensis]SCY32180.1 diguanylate cyclase/phosphodiesterase with PAS/PAC sensor(s) [Legionella israelensis DSM 19235]STX57734.1 sensory box (GGDEF/EAL domain) regulatory protein [Legionella israelensis]
MYDKKNPANNESYATEQASSEVRFDQHLVEQNILHRLIFLNNNDQLNLKALCEQALLFILSHPFFSNSSAVIWHKKGSNIDVLAENDLQSRLESSLNDIQPPKNNRLILVKIQWDENLLSPHAKNRLDIFFNLSEACFFCCSIWVNYSQNIINTAYSFLNSFFGVFDLLLERLKTLKENRLLNTILEKTSESIEITDQNAIIQYVNPAFEYITQYSAKEAIGNSVASLLRVKEASPVFFDDIRKQLDSGKTWKGEIRSRKKDGSLWIAQATIVPLIDEETHKITHHIAIKQDISEEIKRIHQLKINEQRYKNIMNAASDAIFVNDINGVILEANEAACCSLGYTHEEIKRLRVWDIEIGVTLEQMNEMWDNLPDEPLTLEGIHRRKDGSTFPVEVRIGIFNTLYQKMVIAIARDISERKKAENKIRHLALAIEQSPVLILITDTLGTIEYASGKLTELTGYTSDEIIGKKADVLKSGMTHKNVYRKLWNSLLLGKEWRGELLNKNKIGDLFWVSAIISPLRNNSGTITHYLAIMEDITQQKSYEEMLKHQATYDTMTNLPNRITGHTKLEQSILSAKNNKSKLAILFIDLDEFKPINDSFGHAIGDLLLQQLSSRILNCVRRADTVARLGGDEFMIILDNIQHPKDAEGIAKKCLKSCSEPIVIEANQLSVTASIGIAIYPDHGKDAKQLMRHADTAMYKAKADGKNNLQIYNNKMADMVINETYLKYELQNAIQKNELCLHYQPVIEVNNHTVIAAEALLRWHNHHLGYISPIQLIPLAEETDLIMPLGNWILETACRHAKSWQKAGKPVKIAVNISYLQLKHPSFITQIKQVLNRTQLNAEDLILEIAESSLIDNSPQILKQLKKLNEMKVNCTIDDFCIGYSSLSYIRSYPFKGLKIDRSYIQSLQQTSKNDFSLIHSIVSMSRQLKLKVIAKGVETLEQYQLIRDLNCDLVQGYYVSKALNDTQFLKWLKINK